MKQFIKVHLIPNVDRAVSFGIIPVARIESIVLDDEFTCINYKKHAVRVTETVEEVYNLIYPSPFITLHAVNTRDPSIIHPVSLRASAITGLTSPNLDLDQSKTAVDVGDGQCLVDETKAQIEELIRNAL